MNRLLLAGGLFALALAWLMPSPLTPAQGFTLHMVRHLLLVAVAAPLLALGLCRHPALLEGRVPAWLLLPLPLSLLELLIIWGWHAPLPHAAARSSVLWFAAEQASFFLVGLLLWLSIVLPGRARRANGILALLLTSMHMTLLGALFTLAPRVLHAHAPTALCVTPATALADQQTGGMLMLLIGGTVYLAGALYILNDMLQGRGRAGSILGQDACG
jgi:putative membrane protein